MSGIKPKIKQHGNMTQNEENNHSITTKPELTQMLGLVIITIFFMFRKLSRDMEDIKKDPNCTSRSENLQSMR